MGQDERAGHSTRNARRCFCLLLQLLVGKAALKVKSKLQARVPHEQVEKGLGSSPESLVSQVKRSVFSQPSLLLWYTWERGFPEGLDVRGSVKRTKPLGEPGAQSRGGV